MKTVATIVDQVREAYQVDPSRLELARARQEAVWLGRKPDRWPIVMGGSLTPLQQQLPNPNFSEAFYDWELMLCQQIRPACQIANTGSDAIPSIRANTGTATLLAAFGLEQDIISDQMPWLQEHLSPEKAGSLTVDDIEIKGTWARALEYVACFREAVGDIMPIYCYDTQGPFDLAHLLIGDEIFLLMYDNPDLVHHIMNLCTELYIRGTQEAKKASGEASDVCVHGNALFLPNAGVRFSEDTTTLIGEPNMETFAIPYIQRAAAHFGGGWVHFCGRCDGLADQLCACPEIRGINYGLIPGKEDQFDFDLEMDRLAAAGKVYFGTLPFLAGEKPRRYLQRLHGYASRGCLIPQVSEPMLCTGEDFTTPQDALDFWYSL